MARRTDSNQTEIVEALRSVGASVYVTSHVGKGFPDLVVGFQRVNYLMEIKDGAKSQSQTKLSKSEQLFHDSWRGKVHVVKSVYDAFMVIRIKSFSRPDFCTE